MVVPDMPSGLLAECPPEAFRRDKAFDNGGVRGRRDVGRQQAANAIPDDFANSGGVASGYGEAVRLRFEVSHPERFLDARPDENIAARQDLGDGCLFQLAVKRDPAGGPAFEKLPQPGARLAITDDIQPPVLVGETAKGVGKKPIALLPPGASSRR